MLKELFLLCVLSFLRFTTNGDFIVDLSQKAVHVLHISSNSSDYIEAVNIKSYFTLVIFGLHVQELNLTLSSQRQPMFDNSVTGKDIGLASKVLHGTLKTGIFIINENPVNVTALLQFVLYKELDLIPGGCNMEFPTENAPYLKLIENKYKISVEFQHAGLNNYEDISESTCSSSLQFTSYSIFVFYLNAHDHSESEIFSGIENMSNISFIKSNAKKVENVFDPITEAVFFKYPRVVVIYNVVAKYTNGNTVKEAAYVPIVSYDCTITNNNDCVELSSNGRRQLVLAFLSLFGFVVALFGQKYFEIELLFFGSLTSFILSYILLMKYCSSCTEIGVFQLSIMNGIFGALFWVLLWSFFYRPKTVILPIGSGFGFLIIATLLFSPLGNSEILQNSKVFWELVVGCVLFTTILAVAFPKVISIAGSSIVGTYTSVIILDAYIGSNLFFIIINLINSAITRDKGALALNEYPFDRNIISISLWMALALVAVTLQSFMNRKLYFKIPIFTCLKVHYPPCTCAVAISEYHINATMTCSNPERQPLLPRNGRI